MECELESVLQTFSQTMHISLYVAYLIGEKAVDSVDLS